jgi:hypothetical protein
MPITINKIKKVEEEVIRLHLRLLPAFNRLKDELGEDNANDSLVFGSRETGALRRASLDLSAALADLRRP